MFLSFPPASTEQESTHVNAIVWSTGVDEHSQDAVCQVTQSTYVNIQFVIEINVLHMLH